MLGVHVPVKNENILNLVCWTFWFCIFIVVHCAIVSSRMKCHLWYYCSLFFPFSSGRSMGQRCSSQIVTALRIPSSHVFFWQHMMGTCSSQTENDLNWFSKHSDCVVFLEVCSGSHCSSQVLTGHSICIKIIIKFLCFPFRVLIDHFSNISFDQSWVSK